MATHKYVFDVTMTCGGCSGAVDRVLKKLEGNGITSYTVSLQDQKATVEADSASFESVLETIKKTGKKVTAAEKDGEKVEI